jgi:hypothetical protein
MIELELSLIVVSSLLLTFTTWILKVPKDYSRLTADPPPFNNTKIVNNLTMTISFIGLSMSGVYFGVYHPDWMYFSLKSSFWITMLFCAPWLNDSQNAYIGGHFVIFVSSLLVFSSQVPSSLALDPENIYQFLNCTLMLVLILLLGFWHHRIAEDDSENISREQGCSIFSSLFFNWVTGLVKLGNSRVLEMADIWKLVSVDLSSHVVEKYQSIL